MSQSKLKHLCIYTQQHKTKAKRGNFLSKLNKLLDQCKGKKEQNLMKGGNAERLFNF